MHGVSVYGTTDRCIIRLYCQYVMQRDGGILVYGGERRGELRTECGGKPRR